jgi:hypothetical protein
LPQCLDLLIEEGRPTQERWTKQQGQTYDAVARVGKDCSLRFGFRAAISREGSYGIPFAIGGVLSVENQVRGDVQQWNFRAVGQLGQGGAAARIDPLGAFWVALTLRHSRQGCRMHNAIGMSVAEGLGDIVGFRYVERTQGVSEQLALLPTAPGNDRQAPPATFAQEVTAQLTARSGYD